MREQGVTPTYTMQVTNSKTGESIAFIGALEFIRALDDLVCAASALHFSVPGVMRMTWAGFRLTDEALAADATGAVEYGRL